MTRIEPELQAGKKALQAINIHGFVQAVSNGLVDQRMVGHLALAHEVFGTGELVWKNGADQIFSRHTCQLRWHLFAAAESRQCQRHPGNPAPTGRKHGRVEQSLNQQAFDACRMEIARDIGKLEAMSRGQRQHDVVLSGCRLELEVELATEALAQRQPPSPIDAAAIGRVDHELHSTRLIEEAFEDEGILRWQATESAVRGAQIVDQLLGSRATKSKILRQPPQRAFALPIEAEALLNLCSQARDGTR